MIERFRVMVCCGCTAMLALVLTGAASAQEREPTRFELLVADARERVEEVDAASLTRTLRETPGSQIIDVRERAEYERGHYPGAVHLSRGVLEWKIESIIPDSSTPIILYCGGGQRSILAADALQRMGYANVRSLRHGWSALRLVFFAPDYHEMVRENLAGAGEVTRIDSPYGSYVAYRPVEPPVDLLVLAHGYPWPDDSQTATALERHARSYVERWRAFADERGLILIAPLFGSGALAGYRELFGKVIDADTFVLALVDAFGAAYLERFDGHFSLYGHSAGGQFAARFLAIHPDRLRGVVLSAPGRYAMPDPRAPWPHGMAPMRRDAALSGDRRSKVSAALADGHVYAPTMEGWIVAACNLPIRIVIGAEDLEPQEPAPAHEGETRLDYARTYVNRMRALAERVGCSSLIELRVTEGAAHDPEVLTPDCQQEMVSLLED